MSDSYYDLYHFKNNKIGVKIDGWKISVKAVEKAREELKSYQAEMDDFQAKVNSRKRDAKDNFDEMMKVFERKKEERKKDQRKKEQRQKDQEDHKQSDDVLKKLAEEMENIKRLLENHISTSQ